MPSLAPNLPQKRTLCESQTFSPFSIKIKIGFNTKLSRLEKVAPLSISTSTKAVHNCFLRPPCGNIRDLAQDHLWITLEDHSRTTALRPLLDHPSRTILGIKKPLLGSEPPLNYPRLPISAPNNVLINFRQF